MAKRVLPDYYSFNPGTRTITIANKVVKPAQLLLITNVSSNTVIFNFSDPDLYATSYVAPFSSNASSYGTRIVLNYNTASMGTSDALAILIDEVEEVMKPSELLTDNTGKLRTSAPKSLIDTDFEYGLQPIKWEAFNRYQNIPSYFVRSGGASLQVTSIVGSGGVVGSGVNGRSLVTIDYTVPAGTNLNVTTGDIITVLNTQNALSSNCEGVFAVSSIGTTRITYFAKGVANGSLYSSSLQVQLGTVVDSNNQTVRIVHDQMFWAAPSIATDGYVTVTTVGKHGLLPGAPILVNSSLTTSANGQFFIYDVPTPASFRYRTWTPQGDVMHAGSSSGIINTSQTIILVRPEANFLHRPSDGGVTVNTQTNVAGISAVRQTRKYFRYQSGKGIQFSTGTKMCPTYNINTISSAGTSIALLTTFETPTFQSGVTIKIEGLQTNAGTTNFYNGTFTSNLVITTSNVVQYTMSGSPTDLQPGGLTGSTPQLTVANWRGASVRVGFFDDQNGFYFEYNGDQWTVVQRRSTTELMGTVNVVNSATAVTGNSTLFSKQLNPGDLLSIKGQTYEVISVDTDTAMQIAPHYRGITSSQARANLMQEVRVPQSQWNLDRCDGTGPSGYVLDATKMQMFYIDYTWYGAGFIRWGFRGPDGNVFYCHKQANNNQNNQAYMRSGNLPARYEAANGLNFSRFISASTTANGITLGTADTTFVVRDATYWPSSGTILVQQQTSSEVMTYTGKTYNSTLNGWQLTGLARNQLGGDTSTLKTYRSLTFDGGAAGNSAVCAVTYLTCDSAPQVMHWGSSVIMDGGYDDDNSIAFAYTKQGSSVTLAVNTSIAVLSIRLAPSVDSGIVGAFGNREIVNRMQLKTRSLGIATGTSVQVIGLLNPQFLPSAGGSVRPVLPGDWNTTSVVGTIGVASLAQIIDHTGNGTLVTGGEQIFGFVTGNSADNYDISAVRDLGTSIISGDGSNKTPGFPVGPDVLTIVLRNATPSVALVTNLRLSWSEAQA
jgi:hypothetical protein